MFRFHAHAYEWKHCSQWRTAARKERLRNKGHRGNKTLDGYFNASSDTYTSGTAEFKSDNACAADRASSLDTTADRTSHISNSSESSDSCIVEQSQKRMRKSITSQIANLVTSLKHGQRSTNGCKRSVIAMKHAVLPQSGSKIWMNESCMHLWLDKVKQHTAMLLTILHGNQLIIELWQYI